MSLHSPSLNEMISETTRMIMGPDPRKDATRLDLNAARILLPKSGPYTDLEGNEVLRTERPTNVYGVGVLFPNADPQLQENAEDEPDQENEESEKESADIENDHVAEEVQAKLLRKPEDDPDEPPTPSVTTKIYRPKSIGISFLCSPTDCDNLRIEVTGGRYEFFSLPPNRIQLPDDEPAIKTTRLYRHLPVEINAAVKVTDFPAANPTSIYPPITCPEPLQLKIEVFIRPQKGGLFLVTVTLINIGEGMNNDQNCLFQTHFSCSFVDANGNLREAILPYPEKQNSQKTEEDLTMDLLYRKKPQYATGHGCSADWDSSYTNELASSVSATPLPIHWVDTISADIPGIAPRMMDLSSDGWKEPLTELIQSYEKHINDLNPEALPEKYRATARRHEQAAKAVVLRMKQGLTALENDPMVLRAFCLANKAMRLQQIASKIEKRDFVSFRKNTLEPVFAKPWTSTMELVPDKEPCWRAFQIAFLLTSLTSIVDPHSPDREIVDLIWFPTGGGKTEAYLGLIAFTCFYERLTEPQAPRRVQVLMRYTMRLLTAQQFQRSASLVCAIEAIRSSESIDLGQPLTLGIWVGNAMTPNTRREAKDCLLSLRKGDTPSQSLFLHSQCPWCGAEVGTAQELPKDFQGTKKNKRMVLGVKDDDDCSFKCSDHDCYFFDNALPFHVVDDVLLDNLPAILIATVDKFALLPKKPLLRRFFGIDSSGNQFGKPPSLIIQDELHLISEALGSMVGAFESLIHALCSRGGSIPKIVCSTATIRTYRGQVKSLFARERVCVFPPPEFGIGESFFARTVVGDDGRPESRKAFIGIFGSGYLSFQTAEAITIASLLQASMNLPANDDDRDPYWTLLCFFSTLRELGTTLTLMHSAVRNRIRNIAYWRGLDPKLGQRLLHRVEELTSRASSRDLTDIMKDLERRQSSSRAIDACLATSIVEVGIDIQRLSLLCVVGQPKKTSTYIQATGRVGRKHPALVVTLYDHTRARDRSVYESFRSFHERMYAAVEPTSLTPFAPPVQQRALTAMLAAYARLTTPIDELAQNPSFVSPDVLDSLQNQLPGPFSSNVDGAAVGSYITYLFRWIDTADPGERSRVLEQLTARVREWRDWQRREWHCWNFNFNPADNNPMMLDVDPMSKESSRGVRWYVPNSMRDVDSESQLWVYPGGDLPMIPGDNDELYPAEQVS